MERQTSHRKPNILVFFTDQQRWDTTGLHGNPLDLTPNFDRLAAGGTFVKNAFTSQPVCGPARSCMQTGLYATTSGCYRNGIPLPSELPTLAGQFRAGGYDTAYIGKWHLAETGVEPVPIERRGGYRYWLAADVLEFTSDAYRTRLFDANNEPVDLPGYRVDACADAAIRYLDSRKSAQEPFFLFLSFLEPHHQNSRDDYPSPDAYRNRYVSRYVPPDLAALGGNAHQHLDGYYGMVKRLDDALGRIMDALKSLRMLDDTIVVFTSDHGCHFKTRNGEYKRSCHDSSIRVPLGFSGPGFRRRGTIDEMVSLIDLPPTLLDAAGLPIPETMQGRSLLRRLDTEAAPWPDDVFVQISESQVARAVRTKRWKYGVTAPDRHPYDDSGSDRYAEQFLYDLQADPYELTNLINQRSHRGVAEHMKERLLRRMAEAGEAVPDIVAYPDIVDGPRTVASEDITE
ncbi:DUF4976 domain-containing protein [Paenibacillus antri]|uniref:DUF4976 domain-containing protein n=1 Tax=Paenibacillus antri TaxID=2582848 RepID=A0A5R9GHU3_9BACL|nr:sulfatase-like hydrolase/transferase [Paenibacillus antri]TLS53810.1 DUF4976 domain-containing protein [Paenibacillus antri]